MTIFVLKPYNTMDGVIRDETIIEKDIAAIFVNCFPSRTN